MLKTEQEECKEYEEQEIQQKREEKKQQLEQQIREHLFGKESKSMYCFNQIPFKSIYCSLIHIGISMYIRFTAGAIIDHLGIIQVN